VGIIGSVLAPWAAVAGVIAIFGTKCTVELVKDNGEVVDISGIASDTFENVVEKGAVIADEVMEKSSDVFENVKSKANEAISKAVKKESDQDEELDDDAEDDAEGGAEASDKEDAE
jgi:gas vesicle protein